MDSERRRTKAEERAFALMLAGLEGQEAEFKVLARRMAATPRKWAKRERRTSVGSRKERVTIRLDAEMLNWYRGLGHGYQRRINAVLRAYMNGVISKAVERKTESKGRPV